MIRLALAAWLLMIGLGAEHAHAPWVPAVPWWVAGLLALGVSVAANAFRRHRDRPTMAVFRDGRHIGRVRGR